MVIGLPSAYSQDASHMTHPTTVHHMCRPKHIQCQCVCVCHEGAKQLKKVDATTVHKNLFAIGRMCVCSNMCVHVNQIFSSILCPYMCCFHVPWVVQIAYQVCSCRAQARNNHHELCCSKPASQIHCNGLTRQRGLQLL